MESRIYLFVLILLVEYSCQTSPNIVSILDLTRNGESSENQDVDNVTVQEQKESRNESDKDYDGSRVPDGTVTEKAKDANESQLYGDRGKDSHEVWKLQDKKYQPKQRPTVLRPGLWATVNTIPVRLHPQDGATSSPYSVDKPFGTEGKPTMAGINEPGHGIFHTRQGGNTGTHSNAHTFSPNRYRPTRDATISKHEVMMKQANSGNGVNNRVQQQMFGDVENTPRSNRMQADANSTLASEAKTNTYKNIVRQILLQALEALTEKTNNFSQRRPPQPCSCEVLEKGLRKENFELKNIDKNNSKRAYSKSDVSKPLARASRIEFPEFHDGDRQEQKSVHTLHGLPGFSSATARTRVAGRSGDIDSQLNGLTSSAISHNSNSNNDNNNHNGAGDATSEGSLLLGIDKSTFNKFVMETLNFERHSASEIARLDNLLRQLAVAAQTDFNTVGAGVSSLQQKLTNTQQQFVQVLTRLNSTQHADVEQINNQIRDIKTDVFRLHALLTGVTPHGQSTAQGRVAEVQEKAKVASGVDCASLFRSGLNVSGVYDIQPDPEDNRTRMAAFCDMDTSGGGWTVFQRRRDGSDDFFRGWNSYKHGFGSYHHDHWLGLENIHLLTKYGDNVMRIELTDWNNETRWAEFSFTRILDESDGYRILVGGYRGNAGDPFHSLSYDMRMQSMRFSTFDSDNDLDSGGNCALTFTSGWWFNKCFQINLNGVWYSSSRYAGPSMNGIVWDLWPEHFNGYSLKQAEMKLRPSNFYSNSK